jgi:hypothetical protein
MTSQSAAIISARDRVANLGINPRFGERIGGCLV